MTHKEIKELIDKYRDYAQEKYPYRKDDKEIFIHVPRDSTVHLMEDGAFVSAVIWIPKEKLSDC